MKALTDYDEDLQYLCELVLEELHYNRGYSKKEAEELLTLYLHMFFDEELSKLLPVKNRDEDYLHHEGFLNLAEAVRYSLTLKKEPNMRDFQEWLRAMRRKGFDYYND